MHWVRRLSLHLTRRATMAYHSTPILPCKSRLGKCAAPPTTVTKVKEVSQLHILVSELESKDRQQDSFVDIFNEPIRSSYIKIYLLVELLMMKSQFPYQPKIVKICLSALEYLLKEEIAFFPLLHNL